MDGWMKRNNSVCACRLTPPPERYELDIQNYKGKGWDVWFHKTHTKFTHFMHDSRTIMVRNLSLAVSPCVSLCAPLSVSASL